MVWLRKWAILTHRYLGIALGLLFVVWFVSGIGMIYAGGMPRLTQELRLERLPPLDLSRVQLSPAEAAAQVKSGASGRVTLSTVMGRPAYRFAGRGSATIFADTGDRLAAVGPAQALEIAGRFTSLSQARLQHAGTITDADQWTIGQRRQLPLHKVSVNDDARTELYISESGDIAVMTTRGSRALAWVAAIPHWLYFVELRRHDRLWTQVILWTSGIGAVTTLIGLLLGVVQYRVTYAGLMRWHYVTGIVFGVFTLTWVFSGFLSMQPWDWAGGGTTGNRMRQTLSGGPVNLSQFPKFEAGAWNGALPGPAKEIEFTRIQGDPYYVVRGAERAPLLMTVEPLAVRRQPFSSYSLLALAKMGTPEASIVESATLSEPDAYYYSRDPRPPLPVLRIKFNDAERTWFYIDPKMSAIVGRFTKKERIERWIYHGFHSLDFAFWYDRRPLWDVGVIALSVGGALSSGVGLFIGLRRVKRGTIRKIQARSRAS